MTNPNKICCFLFLLMRCFSGSAQELVISEHQHDHHSHEIAVAATAVYLIGEKEFAPGYHAHYLYNIPHSKFGMGVGYERISDDHDHQIIGIVANYQPIEHVNLSLSPGVLFSGQNQSSIKFAIHAEASYEFEIKNFHLGPVAGVAFSPGDQHIGFGIHLGYGF